jgi:hypothetical protein
MVTVSRTATATSIDETTSLLFGLDSFRVVDVVRVADRVARVVIVTVAAQGLCPDCGQPSTRLNDRRYGFAICRLLARPSWRGGGSCAAKDHRPGRHGLNGWQPPFARPASRNTRSCPTFIRGHPGSAGIRARSW